MLLIYRIRGLQSKPIPLLGLSAVRILTQRDKNHLSRCWKIPKKNHMIPRLNVNLWKNFIEFHREFYFWERFEKRVFPTDPLSRTDTFGTHCIRKMQLFRHVYI